MLWKIHRILEACFLLVCATSTCHAFVTNPSSGRKAQLQGNDNGCRRCLFVEDIQPNDLSSSSSGESRRSILRDLVTWTTTTGMATQGPTLAHADFTPGGTLVDRQVGVTVGNAQASVSRKADNTNVLFAQDYYFKFGTAAPWIEPDSTDFPQTMPFVRIQQRYDALKKYGPRIQGGLDMIAGLKSSSQIADPVASDVYQLRPMGLLANNFLASENTGSTNELFLARWYINEIYLLIQDLGNAANDGQAKAALFDALKSATNSYLTLMNRCITPKVGGKFPYLQ